MSICFHHKHFFGNVFERRASKCCGVLKKHKGKVKGEQQISLLMAKELKKRDHDVVPGHLLCRQCVKQYGTLLDDEPELEGEDVNECESTVLVDDTADNSYNHCETPRKRLNACLEPMDIYPVTLHGVATDFLNTRTGNENLR